MNRLLFIYNLGYLKPEHNFHWSRCSREMQPRDGPRSHWSIPREGGGARDMSGS